MHYPGNNNGSDHATLKESRLEIYATNFMQQQNVLLTMFYVFAIKAT